MIEVGIERSNKLAPKLSRGKQENYHSPWSEVLMFLKDSMIPSIAAPHPVPAQPHGAASAPAHCTWLAPEPARSVISRQKINSFFPTQPLKKEPEYPEGRPGIKCY